jgi:hypothetical protein
LIGMRRRLGIGLAALLAAAACGNPPDPAKATTKPTYDKTTGKLSQLTYDRNGNGVIDTWTDMDGAKPLRSRVDQDENGTVDRWEYYDGEGKLLKVGFSRNNTGKPDAWGFSSPDGQIARVEISSTGDEQKIDRWEYYAGASWTPTRTAAWTNGKPTRTARSRPPSSMRTATARATAASPTTAPCSS